MTSDYNTIPDIIRKIVHTDFSSVLDIGMGHGKYGYLIREYKDFIYGRFNKGEYNIRIDGLEAYPKVLTYQEKFYDHIYTGEIKDFTPDIQYDLMLWVDILEHLEEKDATEQFNRYKPFAKQHIISIPKVFYKQELIFNKDYDQHRSLLSPELLGSDESICSKDSDHHIFIVDGGIK